MEQGHLFQLRDPRADLSLARVVDCMAHRRGGRQPLLHLYLWTCLFARGCMRLMKYMVLNHNVGGLQKYIKNIIIDK